VLTGALCAASAVGLWRTAHRPAVATVLIGAAGLGLEGSGVCVTDPVSGYSPGTPDARAGYSGTTAALHDAIAVPIFLGLPAGHGDRRHGTRGGPAGACVRWSSGAALVTAATFAGAGAGFAQHPTFVRLGGLYQRVCVSIAFAWLTTPLLRTRRAAS